MRTLSNRTYDEVKRVVAGLLESSELTERKRRDLIRRAKLLLLKLK